MRNIKKINKGTLIALKTMRWEENEGLLGFLTLKEIDVETCMNICTVLYSFGGKWDKRIGCFTFEFDIRKKLFNSLKKLKEIII